MADPNEIVADLLNRIDKLLHMAEQEKRPVDNIILVGHSLGALLARKLYVVACGETNEALFEEALRERHHCKEDDLIEPRIWSSKVSRIVLLAGMNRGWRLSHHINLRRAPFWGWAIWWVKSSTCLQGACH
jgi:triacylglycerol esterase/lipase EstA (alpha/beta hydrolase family)